MVTISFISREHPMKTSNTTSLSQRIPQANTSREPEHNNLINLFHLLVKKHMTKIMIMQMTINKSMIQTLFLSKRVNRKRKNK